MSSKLYVYAGNRSTVLKKMVDLNLNITHIIATKNSHLEKELCNFNIPSTVIFTKDQAVNLIQKLKFDFFVSTGFQFILPISELKNKYPKRQYINVHPSYLPDLRGADPIPGSILYARNSGVTCHLMDDGIDTGAIIDQEVIPYNDSLNAVLLYQKCFALEPIVFERAYNKNFKPKQSSAITSHSCNIYYSFKEGDNFLKESDSAEKIIQKINAFNTPSKGFLFSINKINYKSFKVDKLDYLDNKNVSNYQNFQIIYVEKYTLRIFIDSKILILKEIFPKLSFVKPGDIISAPKFF